MRVYIPLDKDMTDEEAVKRIRQAAALHKVRKHYGPGPHKSGSPQSVHGGQGRTAVTGLEDKLYLQGSGTEEDPYIADDINLCVGLLAEGHHVRFDQPIQVSTFIDRLGQVAQDMIAKGQDAPNFDLCKVSVAGTNIFCVEHKGFKRIEMPQFEGQPLPGSIAEQWVDEEGNVNIQDQFIERLTSRGTAVDRVTVPASYLRASQMELVGGKVAGIAGAIRAGKLAPSPIWISKDNYVIDGHHRWAANVAIDMSDNQLGDVMIDALRVDMPIIDVLLTGRKFANYMGIAPQFAKSLQRIMKAGFAPTVPIESTDTDKRLVFGWANIAFTKDGNQVSDLQGHSIDIDDLEEAAYNFAAKFAKSGEMHKGEGVGEMVESLVVTPEKLKILGIPQGTLPLGWWVGFRMPSATFAKVKAGEYKMFSIQGHARLEEI